MKILVAGAGISGLGAALELARRDREIVLYDRDAAPPEGSADDLFESWHRPGATQLRHSHVFLARLYTLIRDRHPKLLARLLAAGARELKFHDSLPSSLRPHYRPRKGDSDLTILSCRRTTFESVMRAHVETLPNVQLITDARIRGIELDRSNVIPVASGLVVESQGKKRTVPGDIIVDASGRNTPFPDWLAEAGIDVPAERSPAGIIYYTRHYKLLSGQSEPQRSAWLSPGAGDLGYIKYGVFPADDGHFSITLSVAEVESDIRKEIMRGEVFDRICATFPGVMRWTDPERAQPVSKVYAMGNLESLWRDWAPKGKPVLLGLFAIGDASIRTNPLYGRGCSTGFLQAHILAKVLRKTSDPIARAKLFASETHRELRSFYDSMVRQDDTAIKLAAQMRDGEHQAILGSGLGRSIAEHGVVPAIRRDERVLRSLLRSLYMLQGPEDWITQPRVMSDIMRMWATPRPLKAKYYPGQLGPARSEMLAFVKANFAA
ncbi:MAG: FAD-dependent oxidoreductase [Alphaproteobacteria bacterium]